MSEYMLYDKIDEAVEAMRGRINQSKANRRTQKSVWMAIRTVLSFWLAQSYVGIEKSENLKNKYQLFFETLYTFLLMLKKSPKREEHYLADRALYQGVLYRYLGHSSFCEDEELCKKVVPKYDEIYVSWSKVPTNDYIKSKLRGQITYMICDTKELFGIDLSAFGFTVGNEADVVFPTLEDYIISVQYLKQ